MDSTWRSSSSGDSEVRSPGIDSSLSSVPPVCPRPRPDSLATARPNDAASGANSRVTPSLTPPVEEVGAGRAKVAEAAPVAQVHRIVPAGSRHQAGRALPRVAGGRRGGVATVVAGDEQQSRADRRPQLRHASVELLHTVRVSG